ncbi:MAG TPA: VWA domain-containing protein, partial [Proteobacteria bacterium]|nr:VWA domain-containing protein [Pseudomonadota bacterium]
YYDIQYEEPPFGHVRIVPQLRIRGDSVFDVEYVFQIGVQSHRVSGLRRRHLNLTFSLDTSGSMEGKSLRLLKATCRVIASQLKKGDIVSVVKWRHYASVALDSHVVQGPNDPALLAVIDSLYADGSTDLHSGLVKAYELAWKNYDPERMNRVILISDGQANTGITDIEIIAQAAEDSEKEGIYLIGVGVGDPDDYFHDTLMDEVTDAGKGAYVFIDSEEEAQKQFGERFMRNVEIAAKDVRVELTMPYYFIMDEYHGEEYSENPEEVEPQHLGPNDAMIFHQFLVVCDPDLLDVWDTINVKAHYTNPFTHQRMTEEEEMTIEQMLQAPADQLLKGDAIVAYAEALKEIYRKLEQGNRDEALKICRETKEKVQDVASFLNDDELQEIAELLGIYEGTIQQR